MICGPRIGRFPEYRAWRKPCKWIFGEKHDDQYYRVPQDGVGTKGKNAKEIAIKLYFFTLGF